MYYEHQVKRKNLNEARNLVDVVSRLLSRFKGESLFRLCTGSIETSLLLPDRVALLSGRNDRKASLTSVLRYKLLSFVIKVYLKRSDISF